MMKGVYFLADDDNAHCKYNKVLALQGTMR